MCLPLLSIARGLHIFCRRGPYSRIQNANDNGSMVTSVDLQQVEGTETVFERMQRETNEQVQQRRG